MKALLVYESLFGNTEKIARAIADGLREHVQVDLAPVGVSSPSLPDPVDLVVVGGPTHAFSMTRDGTREDAVRQGADPAHARSGIRDWIEALQPGPHGELLATFDTRVTKVRRLPGSAAKAAARALHKRGFTEAAPPESFYVTDVGGPLEEGEVARARAWGERLGAKVAHQTPAG